MKSVVVDPDQFDWEGDARFTALVQDHHLRDARGRVHASPEFRPRRPISAAPTPV
jgi:hypothetical protein